MAGIDWTSLAQRLGAVSSGGTSFALAALEEIVGAEEFRAAVDHYVNGGGGSELARSVLWHCHPWSAMQRCHELFSSSPELDVRRSAVELLRVVADGRALPWTPLYLEDPDPVVQSWGAGIVDQLLWSELVEPDSCKGILDVMKHHRNEAVRENHTFVMQFLTARERTT